MVRIGGRPDYDGKHIGKGPGGPDASRRHRLVAWTLIALIVLMIGLSLAYG
jgi:hypothetical protein